MKTIRTIFMLLFGCSLINSLYAEIYIIPQPQNIVIGEGAFKLSSKTMVISEQVTMNEAVYLAETFGRAFDSKLKISGKGSGIKLVVDQNLKNELGDEGYRLIIESDKISIESASAAGVFYGIQTFRQLLPPDFEFSSDSHKTADLPCVRITDQPRFSWRAFMLDESRHFKGMDAVKDLLDRMALLKMNVFHWHLTDDQGWRIEIKKYPKLTSVGGFRKDTQTVKHGAQRAGVPHGGFYTQDQIREIIAYASKRHIRIVPEIEMPGHAMAAITAYPWLGIIGDAAEVPVTFGKFDDSFNIADPKVIDFLKDVLSEVFELFPGAVVHIGGDEVKFDAWNNSPMMQKFMKEERLASPADAQIYFTNLISQFIDGTGHRMMGWNEILGDNVHEWQPDENVQVKQKLAESAIVHFWKGNLELINKAVSNGYEVVNSYHSQTYLDYNYNTITMEKAYAFDPVPEELDTKYQSKILGLGCQMWSEWIPTVETMEAQVFPRLAAYAEVGWTAKDNKDFKRFNSSLLVMKKRWDMTGINYHKD
jgi:hexosaminidase